MSTQNFRCTLFYAGQIKEYGTIGMASKSKLQVAIMAAGIIIGANACRSDPAQTLISPDYSNTCCEEFIKKIEIGTMPQCVPSCTQCTTSKNDTVINMDVCLNAKAKHYSIQVKDLDCFKLERAGIKNCTSNRNTVDCSGCKEQLKKICNMDNTGPCKTRSKRNDKSNDNKESDKTAQSSKASHKAMNAKEKSTFNTETTWESAFFTLKNAIVASRAKELKESDTSFTIDNSVVVQIVECVIGAVTFIGSLVMIYKLRNRINRIIHRCIPKTKFPPRINDNFAPNLQAEEAMIQSIVLRII